MTIASTPTTLHFRTATPRSLAFASALGAHLALAALVLLAFSDLVTQPGSTVAGHDMTQSFNWESFNRLALSQGYLPWWNPYTLSGMPSLADFQSQLAYPLNLPLRLLPVQAFFTWGIALHVWIAASGVMALCRVIGTGWLPAFIAGAGFALGGVFAPRVHAGHLMLMYGWAWLPVALAVAIVSIRRRSWLPHPALPLVLTLQFLTGHLQTTIYVYAAVGALFLYAWLRPGHAWSLQTLNWRPTSQWAITLALLTGLAAFMLLPTIVLVKELGRTAGLTYEAAARNSWDMLHVLTLFAPEAMNSIRAEPNDSVTGSHWERSAYCGALLALLAPFGLVLARKHRWYAAFFGVLALVALAFAFGRNLPFFQLHYLVLPGLRHAARILPLFSLSVVVLGALGLDALLRRRQSRLSPVLVGLMAAEAIAIGVLGWLLHLDSGAPLAEVLGIGAWLLPIQLGGLAALVLLPQHRGVPLVAATLLSTLLIAELLLYDKPFIQARSIPDLRIVDRLLHRESVDRVVTNCDGVVQPNDMMALGAPTVNGYNSVFFQSYAAFTFLTMNNQIPLGTKQVRGITVDPTNPDRVPRRMDLLNMMNVTHVLACDPLQVPGFIEIDRRGGSTLYRNLNAWPRAVLTCGYEEVADQEAAIARIRDPVFDLRERSIVQIERQPPPETLQTVDGCHQNARVDVRIKDRPDGDVVANVSAPRGGIVFLSEPYYPERKAWVDGEAVPLYRANLAFTAAAVPPGTHTLELRYEPDSFRIGAAISGAAVIGWLVLLFAWRRTVRAER